MGSYSYFKPTPDTVWPRPDRAGDIEWRLRYAPDAMTREDQLVAASVLAAYRCLVAHPAGTEAILRQLRVVRRVWREVRGEEVDDG